jgi:hypothetical protein
LGSLLLLGLLHLADWLAPAAAGEAAAAEEEGFCAAVSVVAAVGSAGAAEKGRKL